MTRLPAAALLEGGHRQDAPLSGGASLEASPGRAGQWSEGRSRRGPVSGGGERSGAARALAGERSSDLAGLSPNLLEFDFRDSGFRKRNCFLGFWIVSPQESET